jgi:hypothetical protein
MEATTKNQRRRARKKPVEPAAVRLEMNDRIGNAHWVNADLVDVIDGSGFGLALVNPLKSGSTVIVRGRLGDNRMTDHLKAAVRWCVGRSDGTFRAGLEILDHRSNVALDCYEVLQLSPNADPKNISRAYRMLASRYHPDNTETGDHERFIQISEAHQILSDPKKRASYDVQRRDAVRCAAFDQTCAFAGKDNFVPSAGALRGWNTALRHV